MKQQEITNIIQSRKSHVNDIPFRQVYETEAEGGCGVTGFACSIPVRGKHIFEPSRQMHNRGNGRGGGIAAMGFDHDMLGISADILEKVMKAREIQTARFEKMKIHTNARMNSRHIRRFCKVDDESELLLEKAMEKMGLSARAHARILKIARTIADLAVCTDIKADNVAEAIQYRSLDRKMLR